MTKGEYPAKIEPDRGEYPRTMNEEDETMKKVTQKTIRKYLNEVGAMDCTWWDTDKYNGFREMEGGFDEIARSHGTYGCNGLVMQGRKTKIYYVVPSRSSALFLFPW